MHGKGVMLYFVQFSLLNIKFRYHGNVPSKCWQHNWTPRPQKPHFSSKKFEATMHRTGVCSILCNFGSWIWNFVTMATSLQNIGNIIEIRDHTNPTLAAKLWSYYAHDQSYARFCAILALKCKIFLQWQRPFKILVTDVKSATTEILH